MRRGVDYAFSHPDPACLRSKGYTFALRYVWSGQTPPSRKLLTKAEADRLRAAGLDIVSNFESWEGRPLDGYAAGQADARTAVANTVAAGGPADAVVYFSVDFDASSTQLAGPVTAYFKGAASVVGLSRVGVYGGYRTVRYLADKGLARWFWQTFAWSTVNGVRTWHPAAHIRQVRNGVQLCGGDLDLNEAHREPFGAWDGGDDMFTDKDRQDLQDVKHVLSWQFRPTPEDDPIGRNFGQDRIDWGQKLDALLKATAGGSAEQIVAEIRRQGDLTREALATKLFELAPVLAQAIADQVDHTLDVDAAAQALRTVLRSIPE